MSNESRTKQWVVIEYAIISVSTHLSSYATTNTTPGELFLQRKFCTRFNLLKPDLQNLVMTKQATQKKHHDSRLRQFSAGQQVMAGEFRSQDKWLPGVIQSQSGPVSYDVELETGRTKDRIKTCWSSMRSISLDKALNTSWFAAWRFHWSLKVLSPSMIHLLLPHLLLWNLT